MSNRPSKFTAANWLQDQNGIMASSAATPVDYPDEGNEFCRALEETSPWFQFRNELISEVLRIHHVGSGDFLDIGGGNGFQLRHLITQGLIHGKAILVEPGYSGCLNARNRGCPVVYCGQFQNIPWDQYCIRMVGLFDVIEHIKDDELFLQQLGDLLSAGSRVFVNVPARPELWSSIDTASGHHRRYSPQDIQRLTATTPFRSIFSTYYFDFFELPLFIARVLPERLGLKTSPATLSSNEARHLRQGSDGPLGAYLGWRHKQALNRIRQGRTISSGTSLFFVLERS